MMKFPRITVAALAAVSITLAAPAFAKKEAKSPSLVEVAVAVNSSGPFAGAFDTLIMLAANDEEIYAALTGKGQYTVFAPTDTAFENLLAAASANCLELTPDLVNAVLKYHVVHGRRDSGDVVSSDQLRTLLGAFFEQDGGFITDGAGQVAEIIVTDVPASNGIIHAIDTVLLPFPVMNQCD